MLCGFGEKRVSRKLDYFPFDSFSPSFVCLFVARFFLVLARFFFFHIVERVGEQAGGRAACVRACQLVMNGENSTDALFNVFPDAYFSRS